MQEHHEQAHSSQAQEAKETGRIEAFSDGVFAIVTTLLVLELRVPLDSNGEALPSAGSLLNALIEHWPSYLAYLLGFSTVVIMWINHHTLFNFIRRSSHTLLLLNSLLLLAISLVPFPTALVAEYVRSADPNAENLAAMIYSALGFVLAVLYNVLWWHMSYRNRLIDRRAGPEAVRAITRAYMFGPVLYAVAFAVATVSGIASLICNLLLAVFFALPTTSLRATPLKKRTETI